MKASWRTMGTVMGASLGIASGMVLAIVLSGAFLAAPVHAPGSGSPLTLASGPVQQWAFGGNLSSVYSCSGASCYGGSVPGEGSLSLSWNYAISWVVIYTETNVSASQTQVEAQAALGASISFSLSECVNESSSGPCTTISASLNLAGKETAVGFTNLTTGTVDLTPAGGGTPASVPATAVLNGASSESYNFSGAYSIQGVAIEQGGSTSASANFDIGASETSSVDFSSPLGIVPLDPAPGDVWNASAPYTANGQFASGYSYAYTGGGQTGSNSSWTKGSVAPTGTLSVNGTDLGAFTLWDNYTAPPTSVTAQEILLDFGDGAFAASNGWVLIPSGLFSGFASIALVHEQSPIESTGPHPSQSVLTNLTNQESAYYENGVGFIGASETGNSSDIPVSTGGATTPSLDLTAGPEPVSVAEQQYQGIVSGASASGSNPFPWTDLILAVVIVVVVVVAVVAVIGMRRRRPPTAAPPAGIPVGSYPNSYAPADTPPPPPPGYGQSGR